MLLSVVTTMLGGRSNFSTLAFFLVLSLLLLLLQVPSSSGSSQEFCDAKENDRACRDDNLKKGGAVIQDDLEVDFEDEDETVPEEHDRVEDGEPTEIFDKKGDSCVHFNLAQFTAESPSIMLIEAKGRLGNHMIAFTLVQALSKVLKVKGKIN